MSRLWDERIDQCIAELKQLKIDIDNLRAHEGARAQSLGKVRQHEETALSRRKRIADFEDCPLSRWDLPITAPHGYPDHVIRTLNPIEEAERAGFDLSLVDESLKYSYEQRALYHQAALNLALEMEDAGRRIRDRHQPTASASLRR